MNEYMLRKSYVNPLSIKYSSEKMRYVFSPEKKYQTWRRLWVALAEAQKELGLDINNKQLEELRANVENINFEVAEQMEKLTGSEVLAHAYAYGTQCPEAKGIINLGASTAYITDNTDLILYTEAMEIIKGRLINIMDRLYTFADEYRDLPALSYTHFQPADPTTVGKRATMWLQDLVIDFEDLTHASKNIKLLGAKGISGTQANYIEIFEGNFKKVRKLDSIICKKMGFANYYLTTGQSYPRKVDSQILCALSGIAQSCHKFSNDIRFLQHRKELDEPLGAEQLELTTAFKRNPVRAERMASLARFVISDTMNPMMTAATQWLERTQDDSANKRIALSEAFLAIDATLDLYQGIIENIVIYPKVIERNLMEELPLVASEKLLLEAIDKSASEEDLYAKMTAITLETIKEVKEEGKKNAFLEKIAADPSFGLTEEDFEKILQPNNFTGCAPEQTEEFLFGVVAPILSANKSYIIR